MKNCRNIPEEAFSEGRPSFGTEAGGEEGTSIGPLITQDNWGQADSALQSSDMDRVETQELWESEL